MANIPYSEFSYENLLKNLQGQMAKMGTWSDSYQSSTGVAFNRLYATMGDNLHFGIERSLQEVYLSTALLESSIIRDIEFLNYKPTRAVSATATFLFSIPAASAVRIKIPRGTSISDQSGVLKFVTEDDAYIQVGDLTVSVKAVQGTMYKTPYTSTGNINQSFVIENSSVENYGVRVYVNDEKWNIVTTLVPNAHISTGLYKGFEVDELPNRTLLVRLGDNEFGKVPEVGSSISVQYIVTDGVNGNVSGAGTINKLLSPIYQDGASVLIENISATNTTPASGGVNRESTDNIKINAPAVFKTGDRAVTKEDHEIIAKIDPTVSKIYVESERDVNPPNYNMFNRINLYILRALDQTGVPQAITDAWLFGDSAGASIQTPDKGTFMYNLYQKAVTTTKYEVYSGVVVDVDVAATIYSNYGVDLTLAKQEFESLLRDYLSYDNRDLNEDVIKSIVVTKAIEAAGVSYAEIDLKVKDTFSYNNGATLALNNVVPVTPVARGNLYVYVDNTLVGKDDGVGGITTNTALGYTGNHQIGSGNIDYKTGTVNMSFNTTFNSESLTVKYKQGKEVTYTIRNSQVTPTPWLQQITYPVAGSLAHTPIVPGSVRVKIDGYTVAQDIYSGTIPTSGNMQTVSNPYYVVNPTSGPAHSKVAYSTGLIEVNVTKLVGTEIPITSYVTFEYSQDLPSDDILVESTQVAVLGSLTTTPKYIGQ